MPRFCRPIRALCYKGAMAPRPAAPYLVLACGVVVVSTASILIRFAQGEGVPSLRSPRSGWAWPRWSSRRSSGRARRASCCDCVRRDLALALLSGVFLAVHFWSWIASLAYTSVASSTALVTTNPLWVGLASVLILGERLGRADHRWHRVDAGRQRVDICQRQLGAERRDPTRSAAGNLLALLGAVAASGYLLVGRALRARVGLLAYIWLAYGTAAVLLLLAVGCDRATLSGYSTLRLCRDAGLALGPQLLGHTAFNWALRHVSATFVALSILGEPVGSALLALFIFDERFAPVQLAGFVLLLVGSISRRAASERAPQPRRGMCPRRP